MNRDWFEVQKVMRNVCWLESFRTGGLMHAAVIFSIIAITTWLTHLGRRESRTDRRFAFILYAICIVVFLRDLRPDRISWAESLPLHICDITGVMAAVAIHTSNRLARCVLHFWGLVLSSQAFFFPVLQAGPLHSDFWLYWIEHGAIVIAAIYDITVRGYRPGWHEWRLATLCLAAYAAVVVPMDALMNVNYGYLGETIRAQRSTVAAFGPWPQRLPALWLTAIGGMALLMVRWPHRKPEEVRYARLGINSGSIPA